MARSVSKQVKAIKFFADDQQPWNRLIPTLRKFQIEQVDFLSIPGDAPKDFITDREYRPGRRTRQDRTASYIAKVGSKWYPIESFTEHLITRMGQIYGLRIADSKLRIVHGQVRFMSRYFLRRHSEQLTHGAELFEVILGKDNYAELAESKKEREFFTFQIVEEAVKNTFPEDADRIMRGFVEMLTFDALIGHNDRHPYNWGVIVPLYKKYRPRFSPVFDTARALFWNAKEKRIQQMLDDPKQLAQYIGRCQPPIGWDRETRIDFFRLIGLIWSHYERHRKPIERFLSETPFSESIEMMDREFAALFSKQRRQLIKECLHLRRFFLKDAIGEF